MHGDARAAGRLAPEDAALASFLLDAMGCVVLAGVLDAGVVAALVAAFADVLADCQSSRDGDGWYQVSNEHGAVFWERDGRWRIFPKLRPPFDDPAVLAHSIVLDLLQQALGADLRCAFVSSDTVMPGGRLQSPHRELGAAGPAPARAVLMNVPLVRCGPDDGPIEAWPVGAHRWPPAALAALGLDDDVQDGTNAAMDAFAARLPSVRLLVEPGDVILRDAGTLHRGTPNRGPKPRSFLTIAYFRAGHEHDYATTAHNLAPGLLERLHPSVRALLDPQRARPVSA